VRVRAAVRERVGSGARRGAEALGLGARARLGRAFAGPGVRRYAWGLMNHEIAALPTTLPARRAHDVINRYLCCGAARPALRAEWRCSS